MSPTAAVFMGDDVSDEAAFDVLRDWGFGVRIGEGGRSSLALATLPSCGAVPAFLEEWVRLSGVAAHQQADPVGPFDAGRHVERPGAPE